MDRIERFKNDQHNLVYQSGLCLDACNRKYTVA